MMHLQQSKLLALVLLLSLGLMSCEGFFGKKVDPSFIDIPVYQDRAVAYVPIQPVWDQFTHPVDVIIGYDELLYVVDDVTEEIISLDQSGKEVGRFSVPGVHTIAMDRSLDLLALGTFDTLGASLPAIYRVSQKNNGLYGLNHASITNRVLHPFYYKSTYTPGFDELATFNSISVRANNAFYVARSGPKLSQIYGPQDAIVRFDETDDFISTVRVNTNGGIFGDYFKTPFSITTLAKP
ncbi:MAG TPA: hypothetical protein ENJ82_02115, partial [Bacteroidetes bacterium]|nr:hypothetical protein [Bacteroidota bacterium]